MPHGDWAGCLFTANGSKRPFYQIVRTRFMKRRQKSNRIGRWSGKFPITLVVDASLQGERE